MFKVQSVRNGLSFLTTPPRKVQSASDPPPVLNLNPSAGRFDVHPHDMSLSDTVNAVLSTSPSPDFHDFNDEHSASDTRLEHENQEQLNESLLILERQQHIERLQSSEEKYCNSLQRLLTLYHHPLSRILSPDDMYTLFGDIDSIYQRHLQFWQRLQSIFKSFDAADSVLGEVISGLFDVPLRILYQNYVNRHERAMLLLESLHSDQKVEILFL